MFYYNELVLHERERKRKKKERERELFRVRLRVVFLCFSLTLLESRQVALFISGSVVVGLLLCS